MPFHDWTRVYAGLFHDFHQTWSIYLKNALNAGLLPGGMTALVEQKSGPKESDVLTVDSFDPPGPRGGVQALPPPAPRIVRKSSRSSYADKANRITVRHPLGQTVAVIEIVSPGTKDNRRVFRELIEKSQAFLRSGVHLLIVDLFPPTARDPHGVHRAIWDDFEDGDPFEFPAGTDRTLASYDAGPEKAAYVEPLAVGAVLLDMPLYLWDGFYVRVPLEATYQAAWAVMPASLQQFVITGRLPAAEQ